MKALLISIRPQWVELILNFIKKDEIRKGTAIGKAITRLIKEQGVAPMLIYCTKGKEKLWRHDNLQTFGKLSKNVEKQFCAYGKTARELDDKLLDFLYENGIKERISRGVNGTLLNGKVVARFNATAEEIECLGWDFSYDYHLYRTKELSPRDLMLQSRVGYYALEDYLKGKNGTDIHINDLEIFDEPKEIGEFGRMESNFISCENKCYKCEYHDIPCIGKHIKPLTRAPESFCYIEID